MKVLINSPELTLPGGVASYHRVMQPHLSRWSDYLATGSRGEVDTLRRALRMARDYVRFVMRLRRERYDLVFLNPSLRPDALLRDGLFLLLSKQAGRKVLVFVHGWDEDCERKLTGVWRALFRSVFGRADGFVVLASTFRDRLRDLGVNAPVYVETTVVEDDLVTPTTGRTRSPGDPFHVLFLARVERAKGVFEALAAYARLKAAHPNVTFTLAGDGSSLRDARRYVMQRNIPDVEFAGYVRGDAKRQAFMSAHCYLLPSYGEGMPISVLEAMAAGLPVITRPVGGLKDFFEHERMGYITGSKKPAVLADYIERLVVAPDVALEMGRYNQEYARRRFVVSGVARRMEQIMKGVADAT